MRLAGMPIALTLTLHQVFYGWSANTADALVLSLTRLAETPCRTELLLAKALHNLSIPCILLPAAASASQSIAHPARTYMLCYT